MSKRLLTVAQVAELLAVSEKSVYRLVQAGRLPALRIGRAIRIDSADLDVLRLPTTVPAADDERMPHRRAAGAPHVRRSSRWRVE